MVDEPSPEQTGAMPLVDDSLGLTTDPDLDALIDASPGLLEGSSPSGAAASAGSGAAGGADPAQLPPHLRGPQASPAPRKETHYGRWVLGAVGLIGVGILGIALTREPAPEPAPVDVFTPLEKPSVRPEAAAPAGPTRAEQWEAIATVLGELERHANRAKLQLADIPDLEAAAAEAPPEGGEAGAIQLDPAAPPPLGAPDPNLRKQAVDMWTKWRGSWNSDLDYAMREMPGRNGVEASLRQSHDAVGTLADLMRRVPSGAPPTRSMREDWLRRVLEQVHTARTLVDQSRAG